jgi:hypothetical protein
LGLLRVLLQGVAFLHLIEIQSTQPVLMYSRNLQFLGLVEYRQAMQGRLHSGAADQQNEEQQRGRHLGSSSQSTHTAHHLHVIQTLHEDLMQLQIWAPSIMEQMVIEASCGTSEVHLHLQFYVYAIVLIGK